MSYLDQVNGILEFDPANSTPTPTALMSFLYYDSVSNTVKLSQNGAAASDVATTASAAGWSLSGSTISLVTVGDQVGIGTATPGASVKLNVTGDATFKDASITGGNPGAALTGGTITLTGGQGGVTGVGGQIVLVGGVGGSTSGVGGSVSLTGGAGTAGNSAGGTATMQGGAGQGTALGGVATLQGGTGGATGNGGGVTLYGGSAGAAAGTGGEIVLQTAKAAAGTTPVERLRITQDGAQNLVGITTANAPAVSAASNGRLYYNSTLQQFVISTNGVAYAPVATTIKRDAVGQYFLGDRLDYPASGAMTASRVQYTRVWIEQGVTLNTMQTFVNAGATGNINLGVYDQATPTSNAGTPRTLLASTGSTTLVAGDNGTYKSIALSAAFTTTTAGYYWVATIGSSATPTYAVSQSFRSAFFNGATNPALRFETSATVVLPAGPGHTFLAAAVSAIAYAAASE